MTRRGRPAWMRGSDIADLLRLSAPIAVSRAAMMCMALTDAIVLGQMAPGELPYILNSWLPIGVSLGLGIGLLTGVQVLTSEMLGVGEEADSGRIFRRGMLTAIALGVGLTVLIYPSAPSLFFSFGFAPEVAIGTAVCTQILALGLTGHMITHCCGTYLEALRRPMLVTVIMYFGVIMNLMIDLALVAGWWNMPQLGAVGVAWATTGTRLFLVILFLSITLFLTPALKHSTPAPEGEGKRQISVGTGAAISNVAEWGGFNFTYIIATWISLMANTVYGYATQLMGFCFMAFLGIGTATSVRVAESYGRGDSKGANDASRLGVVATLLVGIGLGLLVWIIRDPLSRVFVNADAEMAGVLLAPALAALIMTVAFGIVFDGLQATASMALRARDVVWRPSLIHIGSFFVVLIPAGYMLGIVLERGAQGMAEAAVFSVFVAGMAQLLLLEYEMARSSRVARHSV